MNRLGSFSEALSIGHFKRHTEDKELIDEYFDKISFEKELKELLGKYLYPDGALLLLITTTHLPDVLH